MSRGEDKKREEHRKRLQDLRQNVHKKLAYYEQKPYVSNQEFYHLTKEFFLELLEKEYEPTYEELVQELEEIDHEFLSFTDKQRRQVKDLLLRLSHSHYSNHNLDEQESQQVLQAFKRLVSDLTSETQGGIDDALHSGILALNSGDTHKAREQYRRAREIYDGLSEQEQEQYYAQLAKLFKGVQ